MYYSSTQIPETARVVLHIADWALLLLSAVPLLTFINKRPDIGAGVVVTVMVQALLQCGEMAYSVSRDLNIRIDSFIDEIFYDLFLLMLSEVIIVIIFLARRRGFLFVLHGQAAKDETHIQLEELPSGQSEWK
ncbi:hypothetical protein DFJ73DRAFT_27668 [Zopfochytrium polystomum]|nr:hypothetical protein DFJ73DRAFT_27668 [Zopfochytrium polystomum]